MPDPPKAEATTWFLVRRDRSHDATFLSAVRQIQHNIAAIAKVFSNLLPQTDFIAGQTAI